jgi:hypothetical protein
MKQNPKRIGRSDITDLNEDPIVVWQHVNYLVRSILACMILFEVQPLSTPNFADDEVLEMRSLHGLDLPHSGLWLGMGRLV